MYGCVCAGLFCTLDKDSGRVSLPDGARNEKATEISSALHSSVGFAWSCMAWFGLAWLGFVFTEAVHFGPMHRIVARIVGHIPILAGNLFSPQTKTHRTQPGRALVLVSLHIIPLPTHAFIV